MADERKDGEWYFVKNWWEHQHYRDRRPAWIKLHRALETDPEFQSLTEIEQWRLVKLWLVASDMDGRLPRDPSYIGARLSLYHRQSSVHLLARFEAKGFISNKDIRGDKGLSASPRQRHIKKSREEKKEHAPFRAPTQLELSAYMSEQGFQTPAETAVQFIAYYETRGWIPSGSRVQMKDWRAAVRTWKRNDGKLQGGNRDDTRRKRTVEGLTKFLKHSGEVAGDLQRDVRQASERDSG